MIGRCSPFGSNWRLACFSNRPPTALRAHREENPIITSWDRTPVLFVSLLILVFLSPIHFRLICSHTLYFHFIVCLFTPTVFFSGVQYVRAPRGDETRPRRNHLLPSVFAATVECPPRNYPALIKTSLIKTLTSEGGGKQKRATRVACVWWCWCLMARSRTRLSSAFHMVQCFGVYIGLYITEV